MLDKNLIFAFAAGAVAGVVGARYYKKHEAELSDKLDALRSRLQGAAGFGAEGTEAAAADTAAAAASAAADVKAAESELTLEELEAQKEHLEDLIAELQAKMQAQAQNGAAGQDAQGAAGAGV